MIDVFLYLVEVNQNIVVLRDPTVSNAPIVLPDECPDSICDTLYCVRLNRKKTF